MSVPPKPTVFFSHSSRDADLILPIKNRLTERTGGAIQIFMSSDGASIPFGTNWQKVIEDALKGCSLMFVWVTPNALKSNWIYFESGYAYSRDIHVVPLGFDGIKLEQLSPPLSILQGFNITSTESLNNIVSIINKQFNLTFPEMFDETFYQESVRKRSTENSALVLEYIEHLAFHFVTSTTLDNGEISQLRSDWLEQLERVLREREILSTRVDGTELFSMGIKVRQASVRGRSLPCMYIDPPVLNMLLPIIVDIVDGAYEIPLKVVWFRLQLNSRYKLPSDHHVLGSRLLNTEVSFDTPYPYLVFRYRSILFRIDIWEEKETLGDPVKGEISIGVDRENSNEIPLVSLIQLLVEQRIITPYGTRA